MRHVIAIGTLSFPPESQAVYYAIWHRGQATSALAISPTGLAKNGRGFCAPPAKSSFFAILAGFSGSARAKKSAGRFNSSQRDAQKGDGRTTVRNREATQILITAVQPTPCALSDGYNK